MKAKHEKIVEILKRVQVKSILEKYGMAESSIEVREAYLKEEATAICQLAPQQPSDAQQGWISVDVRLPELRDKEECYKELPFSIDVIMLNPGGHASVGCFDFTERVWLHDFSENNAHEITHWMPLPEPPK